MKIVFLAKNRNAVSSFFVSRGFSWEEGRYGVGSVLMKGKLPFVFEGFQACGSEKVWNSSIAKGDVGVTVKCGVLHFHGHSAGAVKDALK